MAPLSQPRVTYNDDMPDYLIAAVREAIGEAFGEAEEARVRTAGASSTSKEDVSDG